MSTQMIICIAIFLLMIVLFLTNKIPMAFSALIAMMLLMLTGCIDPTSALATFGSTTVITMVSMYIVAAGLSRTQMINKLSSVLLKATGGSFTKVLATYVVATCILGQFVPSIIATFVMVTPLVKSACEQMNISPSKMMFPIAMATVSTSYIIVPIGPYAANYVMYNGYLESYGWTDTQFTIRTDTPPMFITGVVTLLMAIFVIPRLLPDTPDIPIGEIQRRAQTKQEPLNPVREVLGYGIFIAVILGLMSGLLPAWEITMIGAIVVVATGVLTQREAIDNMNMDTIMLYVGVTVLGTALGETGAAEMIGDALANALSGTTNGYIIGAAFFIVAWLMTSFLYNRAVTQVLYPLVIMTCVSMNVNPIGPFILCNIASMSSLITPMATGVVPLAMTAGGYNLKTIFKTGMVHAVVSCVVSVAVTMTMYPI
ncbi:MAG: anion permease [Oscillospiraceae bacterium]|nr:anion permease [Oscillospiraceae bacterium]